MEKIFKIFSILLIAGLVLFNAKIVITPELDVDLAYFIKLNAANAEEGYSCTVKTVCPINGSVSCTGIISCERGYDYVKCDGYRTEC